MLLLLVGDVVEVDELEVEIDVDDELEELTDVELLVGDVVDDDELEIELDVDDDVEGLEVEEVIELVEDDEVVLNSFSISTEKKIYVKDCYSNNSFFSNYRKKMYNNL